MVWSLTIAALGLLGPSATQRTLAIGARIGEALCAAPAHDLYARARYPGRGRVPGVDLYRVRQEGTGDPCAYERRVVRWWPRRGVDVIPIEPGMPLRTWTLRPSDADPERYRPRGEPRRGRLPSLEARQSTGDRYLRRLRGYLHPPRTGRYTFMVAADEAAALYLSSDDDPNDRRRIAWVSDATDFEEWDRQEGQVSAPVELQGGTRYGIEVVHEEVAGRDHVEVAWRGPGMAEGIVPGAYLSGPEGERGGILEEVADLPPPGKRLPFGAPRRFQAHLIAFRGMGNAIGNPFRGDGGPVEPGVVLRLPDGRKRCFVRGSFCEEDKKYIMDLYAREMERIEAGLDRTDYVKRPSLDLTWPPNAKPGEPGTMQVASAHFVWVSGSQGGSARCPWVNEKEPEKAARYREGTIRGAESWWALNEYIGNLMPYWDRKEKHKYEIVVSGTKRDGYAIVPGYAGGGYGGCILKDAGGGPWAPGLWHEWGHGCLANTVRLGGGEAQADMHQCLADPSMLKGNHHARLPWRNIFQGGGGYGYTVFYSMTGDDPNWGYGWFTCLPYGVEEWSVFQTLARVGEQRGLFEDGIRGLGDMVGEYAARLATFDCELEDLYRRAYFSPTRNWLETLDEGERLYRIPWEEAPEPFGANILRLVADEGARELTVDLRGIHDPDLYGDWRASIVAVNADGTRRYSPLWNKGPMNMPRREGDRAYFLTVAATPTALYIGGGSRFDRGRLYSGRHAFRYPYVVRLSGCRPGTPRHSRGDLDDAALVYGIRDPVPAPHDTPAGKRFLEKLRSFQAHIDGLRGRGKAFPRLVARLEALEEAVQTEREAVQEGKRHPNGGGWVADTATVGPAAYVGPDAMVLGDAKVLDRAIVEDFAVVAGHAVLSDHARVSGQAVIKGRVKMAGHSRTWLSLDGDRVAPLVPRRLGEERLDPFGLWANYAMDREEKTILEDGYRYRQGARGRFLGLNLNGYLHGRPAFVVEGDRRGFRFDGATQYGELSPRLADLGAMTVCVTLEWEGRGRQTIFDFGSSPENRFVLGTTDAGRPELIATVAGETVLELRAPEALPKGVWRTLRVTLDGRTAAIWVDGRKAAEAPSGFRPCDAFPPGEPKRNFLAVSRDLSQYFKGTIDRVVVYHTVHEDFGKVPEPIRDSPVRPTPTFVQELERAYGNMAEIESRVQAIADRIAIHYNRLKERYEARLRELKARDPAFLAAEEGLEAAKAALEKRKRRLGAAFDDRPEARERRAAIEALRARLGGLRRQAAEREKEKFARDGVLGSLLARRAEAEKKRASRERELREAFEKDPSVVEERRALSERKVELDERRREAGEREEEARKRDGKLAELRARRDELQKEQRDREEERRRAFEGRPEIAARRERAARARKLRDRDDLSREERERASREERELQREKDRLWRAFRDDDESYGRLSLALARLGRRIRDRENAIRSRVRRENEASRRCDFLEAEVRGRERILEGRFRAFRDRDAPYARLVEALRDLNEEVRERQEFLREELRRVEPSLRRAEEERREVEEVLRERERALRDRRELHIARGSEEMARKVARAEKTLGEATEKALARYLPEKLWIGGFGYQAFRGYYNTPYRAYLRDYARALVGGGEMREDPGFLKALSRGLAAGGGWSTKVDWDWRTKWEVDGRIAELPLTQAWLARVRGPVVTEKPKGAK